MKVVFLDIDGVLNSHDWWMRRGPGGFEELDWHIDPRACARLTALVVLSGASVVVSSTWRLIHPLTEIASVLRKCGFVGRIVDKTPSLRTERGHEIQAWLDRNPVESFVILDDDSDMAHLAHRHIKTDCEHGLTDEHVARAVEMLS